MAEKKWLIMLGILNVLAMAGIVFWYVNRDHTPPVIRQKEEIVYEETMSEDELLKDVTAVDETDGDVSHTLVVEKVVVNQNTGLAMITCGAMDSSGNIVKQSFQMKIKNKEVLQEDSGGEVFTLEAGEAVIDADAIEPEADEAATEIVLQTEEEITVEETTEEETTEEETTEEETSEEENVEEETQQEVERPQDNSSNRTTTQNNEPQVNPEEVPVLNFSVGEVITKKGYNPAWVTVISQLIDNKDDYDYLLRHLNINGDFNNSEVGSYNVTVSVTDSDGHESAERAIRIIVEE